jgi:hypothetical protein
MRRAEAVDANRSHAALGKVKQCRASHAAGTQDYRVVAFHDR